MVPAGRNNRKGFTLIELLTVMTIIGLLAAILLPATGVAWDAVRRARCAGQMKQIGTALTHYAAAYSFYPPYGSSRTQRAQNYMITAASNKTVEDWTAIVADGQLPEPETLFCPAIKPEAYKFKTRQNPWPPGTGTVRTTYSRRYLPASDNGMTPVSRALPNHALAADLVGSVDQMKNQHKIGVNVLYQDGAVEYRQQGWVWYKQGSTMGVANDGGWVQDTTGRTEFKQLSELYTLLGVTGKQPANNEQMKQLWAGLDRATK